MLSLPSLPETHDLLRLSSLELEQASAVKPEWVDAALKASPWVVVRRAITNGNLVPVGPGGSTGFELASGSPTVTETSDLDIVIRAPEPFDRAFARSICIQLEGALARVDVLVEAPSCGFSLDEYAHSQLDKVLVRTRTGRIVAEDPWDVRGGRQSWR
jgi:hypothetical protein